MANNLGLITCRAKVIELRALARKVRNELILVTLKIFSAKMQQVIVYERFEEKKKIEASVFEPLHGSEALIQTLNLMDFLAVLSKKRVADETIEWIELTWNDSK
jgi:hypothetical protein